MSGLMDYTRYLAKVIGPRPTGTEEEQQAALYITEQFQRETGFSANIEEFQRTTNPDLSYAILGTVIALVSVLSIFLPAISIATFIVVVLLAAVFVLETFGHPLLSRALAKGASQNVIAKYQPNLDGNNSGRSITRKLIVVAHYDSGHVTPGLVKLMDSGKIAFNVLESGVMVLLAFLALIRIFIAITGGGALIILNVITVLGIILALLPLVRFVLLNNAPYNEGANNNASGSAALIEIAARICQGSVSESDLYAQAEEVTIHGEEAAINAGLVPEGAVLSYEAQETGPIDEPFTEAPAFNDEQASNDGPDGTEEDRLLAAKAAIAALTGRPVENRLYATPRPAEASVGALDVTEDITAISDGAPLDAPFDDLVMDEVSAYEIEEQEPVLEVSEAEASVVGVEDGVIVENAEFEQVDAVAAPATEAETATEVVDVVETVVEETAQEEAPQEPQEFSVSAYFAAANAANAGNGQPLSAAAVAAAVSPAVAPTVSPTASAVETVTTVAQDETPVTSAATPTATPAVEEAADDTNVAGFSNVPSWFAAAQKNAKRSNTQSEVQRSRFTEALEYAERERIERETAQLAEEMERMEAERLEREAEARARIEEQAQQAEAARAAQEEAARAAAEVEAAEAAAEQVANDIAAETPIPGVDEEPAPVPTPTPTSVDLVQEALDYKASQEAESDESFAQGATATIAAVSVPEVFSAVGEPVVAEANQQERLQNLRTNIPSLSGVIRTKDAARRAAVESLSSKLGSTDFSEQPAQTVSSAAETTVIAPVPTSYSTQNEPAPLRNAPAARNLQAVAGGRTLSSIPSPLDSPRSSLDASYDEAAIDYDMVVPDYDNAFTDAYQDDFASNLYVEDDYIDGYVDDFGSDLNVDYNYSEYDDAFLDDQDFAAKPEPKRKGFFSRFLHRKEEEEEMGSPQQWLGVDDDFDARSVGRARGGWESFRQDYDDEIDDPFADDHFADFGDFGDDVSSRRRGSRWEGGSYSRMSLGHVDMRSGVDTDADVTIPDVPPEAEKDRFITGEIERIYHFRNPAFNTEIWFVAMGCDDDSHDGVRAFIAEHKAELRGSMVIEIESMGAGTLSVAKREGATKKISASSRIKRYTHDAVAATGISPHEVDLSGTESIASIIQKAGFQSMHLFGAEDGRPALKGSADDVLENIDELVFDENTRFVYELLKR